MDEFGPDDVSGGLGGTDVDTDVGGQGGDEGGNDYSIYNVDTPATYYTPSVSIGSQKNGQTTKGGMNGTEGAPSGDFMSDFAPSPYDPTGGGAPKDPGKFSDDAKDAIALHNREVALNTARGFLQQKDALAATPQDDEDSLWGIFGGDPKTPAASDRAKFGEFYQAGFDKSIETGTKAGGFTPIDNTDPRSLGGYEYSPGAARSGLPGEIAFDVAMNPFGRFSGQGEQLFAALQSAIPFGSALGVLRALMMMSDAKPGKASGLGGDNEFVRTPNRTPRAPRLPKVTQGTNKPTLNVPSRSSLRGYGRGTRRVG